MEIIWREFSSNLENWSYLKIKRFAFYEIDENILFVDLHDFRYSSNQIYCAVIYLHIKVTFDILVSLLISKTKVAFLKILSKLSCVRLIKLLNEVLPIAGKHICINNVCFLLVIRSGPLMDKR